MKTKLVRNIHNFFTRHCIKFLLALVFLILFFSTFDYYGPKRIYLKPDFFSGIPCLRSRNLVVQHYDQNGDLWASRGMIIYKLQKDDNKFVRIAHVPTGFSIFWLNNFTFMRSFTHRQECIEIIVSEKSGICALSAGYMWYCASNDNKFKRTFKLPYYGIGTGRGIMSTGIINVNDSLIFIGEYFRNPQGAEVKIYKSENFGKTWDIAYVFPPEKIQHIHSLQQDPYSGNLWICAGDSDKESMIGWSEDNFGTIIPIGTGSQIWCACQLVFTDKKVYWGTDSSKESQAGIYRWDKKSHDLSLLQRIDGAMHFGTRLSKGTIVMSIDREGSSLEKDKKTKIFIITNEDKIRTINGYTWNYQKVGFRSSFAKLRFQRDQGANSLAITCLNQKEIPDGDMVIISENALISL